MVTFNEFERLVEEYNEKRTGFHINDEDYHRNFTRPIESRKGICIGHLKKLIHDNTVIVRHYSSIPEIRKEMLKFLEDFNFKNLFFVRCKGSNLYEYVARIEGLK